MTYTNANGTEYLSCAETAALVRKALKRAFPAVKFSVRSETYSMGASIHIHYTGGPSTKEVDEITSQFASARFDGMIDLQTTVSHWLSPEGEAMVAVDRGTLGSKGVFPPEYNDRPSLEWRQVHFGAHYINASRHETEEEVTAALAWLEAHRNDYPTGYFYEKDETVARRLAWAHAEGRSYDEAVSRAR